MMHRQCKICENRAVVDLGLGGFVCGPCMDGAMSRARITPSSNETAPAIPLDTFARFVAKIGDLNTNGCRLWLGKCRGFGYGQFRLLDEKLGSHRAAWKILVGPITDGRHVLHKCDIPACVSISHLFLGTHIENVADMDAKGRRGMSPLPPRSILVEAQVASILERYSAGENIAPLAKEFGVDLATVGHIVHSRSWPQVARPPGFVVRKKTSTLRSRADSAMASAVKSKSATASI